MAQTRAVMPARYVPLADELLQTTGVSDYSTFDWNSLKSVRQASLVNLGDC
jgi:hypothetical protein